MTRLDINSPTGRGYVIFEGGQPVQIGIRLFGLPNPQGFDLLACWKLDVDGPMPDEFAAWVAEHCPVCFHAPA